MMYTSFKYLPLRRMKMKKFLAVLVAATTILALAGCGAKKPTDNSATTDNSVKSDNSATSESEESKADAKSEGVMTYDEYANAAVETKVVVETYVQAKQSWWDNKCTLYTQDKDGAYFIYDMPCSEEDYAKLEKGTKIKVTGYKAEWSGEVEIIDAEFEILDGNYVAEAEDVTALLGSDDLVKKQNILHHSRVLK